MSTRTPIQVPEELKIQIEDLQEKVYAKTNYGVIQKLIESYHAFVKFKDEHLKQSRQEKERQHKEMLQLTPDTKKSFIALKDKLGLSSEEDLTILLLDHFMSADQMKKGTFNTYLRLRNK